MPRNVNLESLRDEYTRLYNTCMVNARHASAVDKLANRILSQRERYETVSSSTGVPWHVIAAIHALEASLRFNRHLHNGDPLSRKTVHVPANRPHGNPPFTWEESAIDAFQYVGMSRWSDWSIAGTLFRLEGYNGWGYRKYHSNVLSPYLWSFSNHYIKGKYASDGKFNSELVSKQCGISTLFKTFENRGLTLFDSEPVSRPAEKIKMPYPGQLLKKGVKNSTYVLQIQRRLNDLGADPALNLDGDFGKKTEKAIKEFQSNNVDQDGQLLVVDGNVGHMTWESLFTYL